MTRMWLCCVMLAAESAMAAAGSFAPRLEGFERSALIGVDGRLRVAPGQVDLYPLGENRWYSTDWFRRAAGGPVPPSRWYDDDGRLLHQSNGRIRYGDRLQGSQTLWHVEMGDAQGRYLGAGLADAQGNVHFAPMPEPGQWSLLPPDRIVWQGRDRSTRIFDLHGRQVLSVTAPEIWVGGPFAGRRAYVVCADAEVAACRIQDEAGSVLLSGDFDDARPAGDNGWWLRQHDTWMRADAAGLRVGPALYQGAALWPHYRAGARFDDDRSVPLQVQRYANGLDSDTPERGWLLEDGRFVALPKQVRGTIVDYCPGRWLLRGENGDDVIVDAQARVIGSARSFGFNTHPVFPWRLRIADGDLGAAILDCDGKVLFERAEVTGYEAVDTGVMATLAGEAGPRLWLDADLKPHLMPQGLRLREPHIAPPLLVLEDAEGRSHLYNITLGRVVAPAFGSVEVLAAGHLIFLRDGRYGMMLADGREVLPPLHAEILPLSADRVWTRQSVGHDEAWQTRITLYDGDANVLAQRTFASAGISRIPGPETGDHASGSVELRFEHDEADGQSYGVQQWLDRDGQVRASAVYCRPQEGTRGDGKGVLLGSGWRVDSDPQHPCRLPAGVMQALQGRGMR
ncbi:hypothetical protein WG628_11350 [Stenotrophomonas maltophilia]